MTNHYPSQSTTKDSFLTATTALTKEAIAALEKRNLNIELVVNLGWRSSKGGKSGDLEIPYFDEKGEVANIKYRTWDKRFSQRKDSRKLFYNIAALSDWQVEGSELTITEGEFDCLAALQSGYLAVSVPDGAPSKEIHDESSAKYSYLEDLPKKGVVILAVDNDSAGMNLFHDLVTRLGAHRCKWVQYPEGCKDLNDVLEKHGEDGVSKVINGAKWCETVGNYLLSDLKPVEIHEGTPLGFLPLNIRKGDFSIVTGIPNHGKSTVVNYMAHQLALKDWVITFASFEQPPQTHHRKALRTMKAGKVPKLLDPWDLDKVDAWIDKHYNFIIPHEDNPADLEWLLERMAAAYNYYGSHMFIIDPWNEMEHNKPKDMTQTEYTGFAIKQLKRFADKYKVHVMVVAHPAKLHRSKQDGSYPVPSLYDIADSAHWANKPDLGVIVYKADPQDNLTTVIVQKVRWRDEIGMPGEHMIEFDANTKCFHIPKIDLLKGEK